METVQTATYKYKCRECGEVFRHDSVTSYANALLNLHSLLKKGTAIEVRVGTPPGLVELHHCNTKEGMLKERIGLADMVCVVVNPDQ